MENILYLNAVLPYIYMISVFVIKMNPIDMNPVYTACGIAMLIQIVVTLIISVLSKNKSKLAEVNLRVKLIQIPYYVSFFVLAGLLFLILMGLMGIGIFVLPFFLAIDAAIFTTTVIPAEICAIKLKMSKKISVGRLLLYLIFNTWYVIDILMAFCIRNDYRETVSFSGNQLSEASSTQA